MRRWLKAAIRPEPEPDGATRHVQHDRALVRRMQKGDERAVAEFCEMYLPRLYRYVLHRVSDPDDAEDIVQVVITNAARRIETFRGEASLYSWLLAICRREMWKQGSAKPDGAQALRLDHDGAASDLVMKLAGPERDEPEAASAHRQLAGRIRRCLDSLPPPYGEVLELKYACGYNSKEIASQLRISDEAVQSLLARARRRFREVCDDGILQGLGDASRED